jgi:predicted transposase YbfD/YdcC
MEKAISIYFASIPDPRVVGRCDHLLSDILLIAICTYLTGVSDYQDMHLFAKERADRLSGLLVLPNGVPSPDTFERVFKRLDGKAFEQCLHHYGQSLLSDLREKQLILDGKKLKGASPTSLGNSGLYLLNAWVSENKFCIGQKQLKDKSNEITAIPELLVSIDITGTIVTIDAIGTQRNIAAQIRSKDAHYLLSVKGNQQELLDDMECAFKTHKGYDYYEELDCGHGRIETRKCSILRAKDYLLEENILAWKDISTLVKVESIREINGLQRKYIRYFISNQDMDKARYYNSLVRDHWSIENSLHWHLDGWCTSATLSNQA